MLTQTVEDLPEGPFHLAVVMDGKTSVPILDGEVRIVKKRKQLKDLANGTTHAGNTIVPLYQQTEESLLVF